MIHKYIIILLVLFMQSCSSLDPFTKEDTSSGTYTKGELGSFSSIDTGTILSIRQVDISGSKGLGTTLGTVIGGIAGSSSTEKKYNKEVVTAIGALAGALLGSTLEELSTKDKGYEFLIQTKSGVKAFVDLVREDLKVGDEVYIIHSGNTIRISKK